MKWLMGVVVAVIGTAIASGVQEAYRHEARVQRTGRRKDSERWEQDHPTRRGRR